MTKIFYFSGTGNTKLIAEDFKTEFERKGEECSLINIEEGYDSNDLSEEDTIGIMYPIYALGTPRNVSQFFNQMSLKNNKVFIIKTAGDFVSINDNASKKLIRTLHKKGAEVFYDRVIIMGSNIIIDFPDEFIKQLYDVSKLKVKKSVEEILNKTIRLYEDKLITEKVLNVFQYMEEKFGAKYFGLSLKSNEKCNKCMLCVNNCPMSNIEMKNSGLKFSSKCVFCMRCIYICPKKAIKSKYMNLFVIKSGFQPKKIINDESIDSKFVDEKTRGYYKHFLKYIENENL